MPGSLARSLVHLRLSAMILTQLVTDMNAEITRETHRDGVWSVIPGLQNGARRRRTQLEHGTAIFFQSGETLQTPG